MDRFIEVIVLSIITAITAFKIQYGQIYRKQSKLHMIHLEKFKIQYGQIYSTEIDEIYKEQGYLKSNMDRFIVPQLITLTRQKQI